MDIKYSRSLLLIDRPLANWLIQQRDSSWKKNLFILTDETEVDLLNSLSPSNWCFNSIKRCRNLECEKLNSWLLRDLQFEYSLKPLAIITVKQKDFFGMRKSTCMSLKFYTIDWSEEIAEGLPISWLSKKGQFDSQKVQILR